MTNLALLLLLLAAPGAPAGAAAPPPAPPQAVATGFAVLVGFPAEGEPGATGVLLVPGTVLPLDAPAPSAGEREALVPRSLALSAAVDRLWSTFRLDPARRIQRGTYRDTPLGAAVELPVPEGSGVRISATLLGFDERLATYRVVFREGERVLADTTAAVTRGGRAVVGGLDGEAAPYLFVLVEPEVPGRAAAPRVEPGLGLREPVALRKVPPAYPEEARKARATGIVVLEAEIGADGRVADVRVLESPSPLLTGTAVEAVRTWEFEPARDAAGRAVAVRYVVTLNFALR
ncbi:MAG: energy transducer TonB [Thermoanaerobaculia bacterium]|nr:energy transducer TonB [Thermoanaerobaculia bacterium]